MVDQFGGSFEHALAAYNAGSDRVEEWMGQGAYRDSPEFVESIPFTETREYVQAIMRNAASTSSFTERRKLAGQRFSGSTLPMVMFGEQDFDHQ